MSDKINNTEENILIVIESVGKKEKIKKIFNEIGFLNVDVFSTKGRLLDLPSDSMGFDKNDFGDFVRLPLRREKVDELVAAASGSDAVFIFTDDDIEGEVIASDVFNIIGDKTSYRLRCQSINKQAILSSLSKLDEVNESLVLGGLSRRIFDRFVGFNTPKEEFNDLRVGRVITPTFSALKELDLPSGFLNYSFENDGEWNITIPVMPSEVNDVENLFFELSNLEDPEIELLSHEVTEDDSLPFNCGDALLYLSESLDQPVSVISSNMQELYEEGRLSYPRTDSFYLSDETINSFKKMALNFGVDGFDSEFLKNKIDAVQSLNSRSQDSHEGLHVLDMDINLFGDCSSMTLKDQIMTLVARQNLRAGQSNKKKEKRIGKISTSNGGWNKLLSKLSSPPIVESSNTLFEKTGRTISLNPYINPLGVNLGLRNKKKSSYKAISNDQKVLKAMITSNIGRPSTLSFHATKIGNRFLTKEGLLNSMALKSINSAHRHAPGLVEIENALKIEDNLYYQGGNINERVNEAIKTSGISVGTGEKSGTKEVSDSLDYNDNDTGFQTPSI